MRSLPEFKVGHFTDSGALTGCTVIVCPPRTCGSCEVRGSSPGSRELALLAPDKTMQEVHAILLTGGSAFGLSAADGVVRWLAERNIGYRTPWGIVPIVPAAVVFDLNAGDGTVRPDASSGYTACEAARSDTLEEGNVGAGTGATVGKWAGIEYRMKGGIGIHEEQQGELVVAAIAVVNSVGDVVEADGSVLAGARSRDGVFLANADRLRTFARGKVLEQTNTTLVVATTNAELSKVQLYRMAQRMHDGISRAVIPAHTSYDGDVTFALSSGAVVADFDLVAEMAAAATAEAIRRGVRVAKGVEGIPGVTA